MRGISKKELINELTYPILKVALNHARGATARRARAGEAARRLDVGPRARDVAGRRARDAAAPNDASEDLKDARKQMRGDGARDGRSGRANGGGGVR